MTDDSNTPLLEAWKDFAGTCLDGVDPKLLTDEMMCFFAGAAVVVKILNDASDQAGAFGTTIAFHALEAEVEAFAEAVFSKMAGNPP